MQKFTEKEIKEGWEIASLHCTATLNELLENNEELDFFVVDSCACGMTSLMFIKDFGFVFDGNTRNCIC